MFGLPRHLSCPAIEEGRISRVYIFRSSPTSPFALSMSGQGSAVRSDVALSKGDQG
jgi:hypothetical protein